MREGNSERQFPQLKGQFLVDRDGIVRWANIECSEGIAVSESSLPRRLSWLRRGPYAKNAVTGENSIPLLRAVT